MPCWSARLPESILVTCCGTKPGSQAENHTTNSMPVGKVLGHCHSAVARRPGRDPRAGASGESGRHDGERPRGRPFYASATLRVPVCVSLNKRHTIVLCQQGCGHSLVPQVEGRLGRRRRGLSPGRVGDSERGRTTTMLQTCPRSLPSAAYALATTPYSPVYHRM
jgi:hypothetical protein